MLLNARFPKYLVEQFGTNFCTISSSFFFSSGSVLNKVNVTQNGSSSGLVSRCCRASSCRPSYLVSVGEVESGTRPSRLGVCQFCEVPSRPTLTLITLSGSQSDNGEEKKKESARVGCEASLCRAPARSRSHVSC